MKPAETAATCEACDSPACYAESVPDANVPGYAPSEAGYRLKPLCWLHKIDRKSATARFVELYLDGGVGRIDRGRYGGDVVCEDCRRKLYDHQRVATAPYLTLLCDGSVCKL